MMARNRKGGMKKVDDYFELKFSGNEDYLQCVCKVLESLSIDIDDSHKEACLFRLNGSKVMNEPFVDEDGIERPWVLARYLESVCQKQAQYKLGVGIIEVSVTS